MQRRQSKWNCESIKITKNEITETEFNEKLERLWELLQGLNCQPQNLFHLEKPQTDLSVQDQQQNWRAA